MQYNHSKLLLLVTSDVTLHYIIVNAAQHVTLFQCYLPRPMVLQCKIVLFVYLKYMCVY